MASGAIAESLLTERFHPEWNSVVDGFGLHHPGRTRFGQRWVAGALRGTEAPVNAGTGCFCFAERTRHPSQSAPATRR
ncbi:MAG: Eco29kI family restriction endonuclease [Planctomycetaceae bacterium]